MWQQPIENDAGFHCVERAHFRLCISTRAKKGVLDGRSCSWNIYLNFYHWNYGYVQISNAFVGTIDEAKRFAEGELNKLREDIPA